MTHGGNVWQGEGPKHWLDYSANLRPEGAPEWVKSALLRAVDSAAYYPDPEMKRARRAMAQYLNLPEENVLPTAGGISAIDLIARRSERAVLTTPCFEEYERQSREHGAPVRKVSLLDGRRLISPAEALRKELRGGETVWLCNPMNPVGAAFSRDEVAALLRLAEDKGAFLAVDEAFGEYCPEHSVRNWVTEHPSLAVVGSLTKILGIPGVRLGYLCADAAMVKQLHARQITWEVSCFASAVAEELPDHAAEIEADAARSARRREALRAQLEALGAFVYPSQAPFLLADFGFPVEKMAENLRKKGILVRSCMSFDGLADGRHLRLAVKDEESNARLIAALREEMTCAENR